MVSLLILVNSLVSAQDVTYSSEDKSHNNNLLIGVSLLDINLGFPTLSFSGGIDADFYFKRFSAETGFRYAYLDLKKNLIEGTNESGNNLKNYFDFRIGGRFHLSNKQGKVEMKSTLHYENEGITLKETYIPVMVPTQKIVALHGGFQRYNIPVKRRNPFLGPAPVIASDGTGIGEFSSGTNLTVGMLYGGFSFIDIMEARIRSGTDTWNYKWYRNIYVDFLYAPYINVQDILISGKSYIVQGEGTKGFEKGSFGGRFGYSNMSKNVFLRYEIGWLPGLSNTVLAGLFTQATFGFSIVRGIGK